MVRRVRISAMHSDSSILINILAAAFNGEAQQPGKQHGHQVRAACLTGWLSAMFNGGYTYMMP